MSFPTSHVFRIAFSSNWNAASPSWDDVTSTVVGSEGYRIDSGGQYDDARVHASTADFTLLNTSGDFWPDNTGGAYTPNVLPGKRVNIRAVHNSITYDLFTGYIESWNHRHLQESGQLLPAVALHCVDGLRNFARSNLNDATGYVQESTGARVTNIADDVGWPSADRSIAAGNSGVQQTGELDNANARQELDDAVDTEFGLAFVAGDGTLTFQERHARLVTPLSTSQATFGDDPGELRWHDLVFEQADVRVANDVRITRVGGTEKTASDATSEDTYGPRTFNRTGTLHTTDNIAESFANFIISRRKDATGRLRAITIRPGVDPTNLFPQVLGRELSDKITINYDVASIAKDYHIEGISHDVQPRFWETTWWLSEEVSDDVFIIGTSLIGTGQLAF